jgi:hypothetical protein
MQQRLLQLAAVNVVLDAAEAGLQLRVCVEGHLEHQTVVVAAQAHVVLSSR